MTHQPPPSGGHSQLGGRAADEPTYIDPFRSPASGLRSIPPTGVLVITVWADATVDELRLRVASNTDVITGAEHRFISSEPEEVLGFVRSWLTEFGDAIVTASRRRPVSVVPRSPTEGGGYPEEKGD